MWKETVFWLLHLLGITLFLSGYFQMKSNMQGFADMKELPSEPTQTSKSSSYNFSVKHLVLVVIDALRTDFVTQRKQDFSYLTKMLEQKKAILYEARAHHPTVTLPRIKAITSGGIPGFMDVVYNFHSTEFSEDNIITQTVLNKKNVNFYGDDTWLKLFPAHFKRKEGTTSFFVNDYIEVDRNVTNNVEMELKQFDWDFLIIHYLGLDHIGHTEGPFSPLVPPKLREMDGVIEKIHSELKNRDGSSIIIVCGDHGMSDSGSHGGASKQETSVPIIFIHSHDRFFVQSVTKVDQISITPTIAVLLNLPIPKNNLGVVLTDVLINLTPREILYALFFNYNQISKLKGDLLEDSKAINLHKNWLQKQHNSNINTAEVIERYSKEMREISDDLSKQMTQQNWEIVFTSLAIMMFLIFVSLKQFRLKKNAELSFQLLTKWNLLSCLMHSFSFFSSSFIEEEHLLWYYFSSTTHSIIAIECFNRNDVRCGLCAIISWSCSRVMRNWNQTGDKWASLPDLNKWINRPENCFSLLLLFICGLIVLLLMRYQKAKRWNLVLTCIGFAVVFLNKISVILNFDKMKEVFPSNVVYLCISLILVSELSISTLITSWLILSSYLMRPHNVALLGLTYIQEYFLSMSTGHKNSEVIVCIYYTMAMTSFYYQGNSNSLSRIDVAAGFIGLSNYNIVLVSFQLICHTYAGFIFWTLSLIYRLTKFSVISRCSHIFASTSALIFLIRNLPVFLAAVALTVMSNHLFVWSVFAPKFLYESFHSLLMCCVFIVSFITIFLHENTSIC